jgi:hypothetical protein
VDTHPPGYPGWGFTTTCVPKMVGTKDRAAAPPSRDGGGGNVTGVAVCKYGPPLPPNSTLKNVLIIGDSVSIGYTPVVASIMQSEALVQHAPWGGDGGAEETAYVHACSPVCIHALRSKAPFKPRLATLGHPRVGHRHAQLWPLISSHRWPPLSTLATPSCWPSSRTVIAIGFQPSLATLDHPWATLGHPCLPLATSATPGLFTIVSHP